jgi:protein TonB
MDQQVWPRDSDGIVRPLTAETRRYRATSVLDGSRLAVTVSVLLHGAAFAALFIMQAVTPPQEPPIVVIEMLQVPAEQPVEQAPPEPVIETSADQPVSTPTMAEAAPAPVPLSAVPSKEGIASPAIIAPPPSPPRRLRPQRAVVARVAGPMVPAAGAAVPAADTAIQTSVPPVAAVATAPTPPPDYVGLIQARLLAVKRYPTQARARDQQGVVSIYFVLAANGTVLSARVSQSSGVASLDDEGLAMVARAAPFPPLPETIKAAYLALVVPVAFSLHGR